jgi:hypothetical protein
MAAADGPCGQLLEVSRDSLHWRTLPIMRAALAVVMVLVSAPAVAGDKWIPLFNGKDLGGWRAKIRGFPLGDNHLDTFRVDRGVLRVSYDRYQSFGGQFGHLVYQRPFSRYRLRIEYRFLGQQAPGGPKWAFRNSGVMIHGQAPETMALDQDFPVSVEVQFLGGPGSGERSTANVCTPGTNIVVDGKLTLPHCLPSTSKTFHGDQWVTVEVLVRGGALIEHRVNGVSVLRYGRPQLDERDAQARRLGKGGTLLDRGYIYLQAESHPVEFRKVEILPED